MALFYRGKHGKRIRNEEHAFLLSLQLPPPSPSYYVKASSKGKFLTATQREEREREEREAVVCAVLACAGTMGEGNSPITAKRNGL
jgi:hypothetical protein